MLGLDFNVLPGGRKEETPYTVIDDRMVKLQRDTYSQEQAIRRAPTNRKQKISFMTSLQAQYDERKASILSVQNNVKRVEDMMSQGLITPEAGKKAMWGLVLPAEISKAMFPSAGKDETISPYQLRTEVQFRADAFSKEARGWGKKNQRDLIPQYEAFRERVATVFGAPSFDGLSPTQKRQIDAEWDLTQRDLGNQWDPESAEVRALRAGGTLGKVTRKLISPVSKSIWQHATESDLLFSPSKELQDTASEQFYRAGGKKRELDEATARKLLKEAGGSKAKARILAEQRGYEF